MCGILATLGLFCDLPQMFDRRCAAYQLDLPWCLICRTCWIINMSHISCICRCCRTCAIEDVRHIGYFRSVLLFAADARSQMCSTSAEFSLLYHLPQMCGISAEFSLLCHLPQMFDGRCAGDQLDQSWCVICRTSSNEYLRQMAQQTRFSSYATHLRSNICGKWDNKYLSFLPCHTSTSAHVRHTQSLVSAEPSEP